MSALPWFKLYIGDWSLGVAAMTMEERGVYITLLVYQWDHGAVPSEPAKIALICGGTTAEAVLQAKFTLTDAGYVNARCSQERERAVEDSQKKRRAGRAGGKASARSRSKQPLTTAVATVDDCSTTAAVLLQAESNDRPSKSESESDTPSLTEKAPRRKTRVSRTANTPQAKLLEWFGECFAFHREGEVYVPAKQDFVHAHWLLENHSRQEVKVRCDRMLMKTTTFWLENSSIALLRSKWNGLSAAGD